MLLEAINFDLSIISTPIGGSNEILQDGKNGYILNLEKGKKPNSENLKNIILETINKKELTEDKKKTQKCYSILSLMRKKFSKVSRNIDKMKNLLFYGSTNYGKKLSNSDNLKFIELDKHFNTHVMTLGITEKILNTIMCKYLI